MRHSPHRSPTHPRPAQTPPLHPPLLQAKLPPYKFKPLDVLSQEPLRPGCLFAVDAEFVALAPLDWQASAGAGAVAQGRWVGVHHALVV